MKITRPISISQIVTLIFALLYGVLEYYLIQKKAGTPFPGDPLWAGLYTYHLLIKYPLFVLVGYACLLPPIFSSRPDFVQRLGFVLAGLSTVVLGVVVEDVCYFLCRVLYPRAGDPGAGSWIQQGEWTTGWGTLEMPFGVIPWWYVFAVFLFLILLGSARTVILYRETGG